ncbi:hypothetical protein KUTeg_009885 [Tegillarca granosa]|uniref:Uncharacterized protein n=1 Tax=Tegillarca granosa TaxID=220873 RepID=A0ABQ9F886_TEGGR|nr:hypothetical protein KUTeg_009885 [Tegillarca granosa]
MIYPEFLKNVVPGFMTWYNLKFEKDRAIYTYELEKDYSRGDLEILIAVDSDENDIDNACVVYLVTMAKRKILMEFGFTIPKISKSVVQVFGLKDAEIGEVARHMGHELSVQKECYRLQDDVIELAKISKLLLAVEKGKAHKFHGLSLDDIYLNVIILD